MDIPMPSKEELEEYLELAVKAQKEPGLDTWTELADYLYDATFNDNVAEDEEVEISEDEFNEVLHALVEITWEAWQINRMACQSGLRIGFEGDISRGLPPFLNMRVGWAHLQLAMFLERSGEMSLQLNAQTLGRVLQMFHMSEAFIRPGMITAAFLLRLWSGEHVSIEEILLRNYPRGGKGMASYGNARDSFLKSIELVKRNAGPRECLDVLDRFMTQRSEKDRDVTIHEVRNAIAHHNMDILEGDLRIGWISNFPQWDPKDLIVLKFEELKEILKGMRGFVMTLFAWDYMMAIVIFPPDDFTKLDTSALAKSLHDGLDLIKRLYQPFF